MIDIYAAILVSRPMLNAGRWAPEPVRVGVAVVIGVIVISVLWT